MKTFKDLKFDPHPNWIGVQAIITFDNGRGVSVIKANQSYGGSQGLWEIAVLNKKGELDYTTPITDDVLGWLTEEEVTNIMKKVQQLTN